MKSSGSADYARLYQKLIGSRLRPGFRRLRCESLGDNASSYGSFLIAVWHNPKPYSYYKKALTSRDMLLNGT